VERTLLKIRHAQAVRDKDRAAVSQIERDLAKIGVVADWLTDDVMVWREGGDKKKRKAAAPSGDYYPDSACTVCSAPIEKTGKPGRPPVKCLHHR
jgi:hypothetical protein